MNIILKRALFALYFLPMAVMGQQLDNDLLIDMLQGQRYKDAAAYIRSVYPGDIKDLKIISRLAYYDYMSGKLVAAENGYNAVLAADSTSKTALNYLGLISEQRRNYAASRVIFEKMVRLDSLNPAAYIKLARILEFQRDTVALVENLTKANKLDPENPDIGYDLAMLMIKQKKYDIADTVLTLAIKADPKNVALMEAQARMVIEQRKYKEAVKYAQQAIKAGSASAEILNILGQGQYYTRQYKECIATYAVLEGIMMTNETTFYYTALSYRQLGNIQKSIDYLYRSIKDGISYSVPIYYQELSVNNEKLGRYNTSINLLNKAEEFNPKNVFNYARARIYDIKLNNVKNALIYYRKYLKNYDAAVDDDEECYKYSQLRVKELGTKSSSKR